MTYIEPTLWAQKQFGQAHLNRLMTQDVLKDSLP